MQNLIPGQGMKRPLNMIQQPIAPNIKKALPPFKWSGKYWVVDVGQTLLDTGYDKQQQIDSILQVSRDHGRDRYGHSSYQEKIDTFRPPLENYHEHHGPLNRLPTKLYAVHPRINPGTAHDTTTAFSAQNQTIPGIHKYTSDKISTDSWATTFFAPMEMPIDTVLPDLVTTLPSHSMSAGCETHLQIDNPQPVSVKLTERPQGSSTSGYRFNYEPPLSYQTDTVPDERITNVNKPQVSGNAGYRSYTVDGDRHNIEELSLARKLPTGPISSGYHTTDIIGTVNGERRNIEELSLARKLPSFSISSGYHNTDISTTDVQGDRFQERPLEQKIDSPLHVGNPGSEIGYQTRIESFTPPTDYIKLRQNPQVPFLSGTSYDYKEENDRRRFYIKPKLRPLKNYGLFTFNGGTIPSRGVQIQPVTLKYDSMRRKRVKL
jgi:hypothetical protein